MSNFDSFTEIYNFDTPIVAELQEFTILPEGEYPFTITDVEKKYYEPGPNSKLPPCPQITVTFMIDGGTHGQSKVTSHFFYYKTTIWRVNDLFIGVGLAQKGQQFVPNPDLLLGKTGVVRLKQCKYTRNNGEEGTINEFDRCVHSNKVATPVTGTPTQNSFGGF